MRTRTRILEMRGTRNAVLAAVSALALSTGSAAQNITPRFELEILRQYPGGNCTSGYLSVNGKIIAYSLERKWNDNKKNISSIPNGSYPGILRYDKSDHWRIELAGVPGRDGVQIHVGNQPDQSQGCILVGLSLGKDNCSVLDSQTAYQRLKNAFYGSSDPKATPDMTIVVKVSGVTKP